MASGLRIGIDFDNTVIAYDQVFCATAKLDGLISADFAGGKQAVRDCIRSLPDGEQLGSDCRDRFTAREFQERH